MSCCFDAGVACCRCHARHSRAGGNPVLLPLNPASLSFPAPFDGTGCFPRTESSSRAAGAREACALRPHSPHEPAP